MAGNSKENALFIVKFCQQTEMFQDMAQAMKKVVLIDCNLTAQQRKLLTVAYENVVGPKKEALRKISAIIFDEEMKNSLYLNLLRAYRAKIDQQLKGICNDMLGILDQHLIPNAKSSEAKIYYLKMKGDFHKYMTQYQNNEQEIEIKSKSIEVSYKQALILADQHMKPTDPIKIELIYNYSVFLDDIKNERAEACRLVKQGFDNGISYYCKSVDEQQQDTLLLLQKLRDNLTNWTLPFRD